MLMFKHVPRYVNKTTSEHLEIDLYKKHMEELELAWT